MSATADGVRSAVRPMLHPRYTSMNDRAACVSDTWNGEHVWRYRTRDRTVGSGTLWDLQNSTRWELFAVDRGDILVRRVRDR